MQSVDTGGSIVGCHDGSKNAGWSGDGLDTRIGNLNVLFANGSRRLFVQVVLGRKASSLLGSTAARRLALVQRLAQSDAERVLSVGELVDKITRVTPDGKVGVGVGGVEGGVSAVLIVMVEQISSVLVVVAVVAVSWAGGRGEGVQRDVSRPPFTVWEGRNLDGGRLFGSSPTPQW